MSWLDTQYNYLLVIGLMMTGLYIVLSTGNLIRRMIGVALFQTSIGIFYISIGKVAGGTAPILIEADSDAGRRLAAAVDPETLARYGVDGVLYSHPLTSVLILTAIVVSVATMAVGLAIVVRVGEAYGSVEIADVDAADRAARTEEDDAAHGATGGVRA
jgi:multicomponent Na+:H+ antiporter subunit C